MHNFSSQTMQKQVGDQFANPGSHHRIAYKHASYGTFLAAKWVQSLVGELRSCMSCGKASPPPKVYFKKVLHSGTRMTRMCTSCNSRFKSC